MKRWKIKYELNIIGHRSANLTITFSSVASVDEPFGELIAAVIDSLQLGAARPCPKCFEENNNMNYDARCD